ncbi:MAG: Fe-S protein assembly co-chaperone HscB [Burkholderiaceae bacterium]|nr:Fe-S protein assembly co-chaperone HscB [Burkholderiaceae bacterium]MDH3460225.1 Fe-S protein assembly co-chaperone HscB [Burkholderiaceae bacterium]
MNLDDNDFDLFGVPQRQAQDNRLIDVRWRALQADVHPDRFAADGAAAQRVAMQWAVRVNEAHERLKNPLARAAYLCELHGVAVDAEKNTAMPSEFLVQQLEWREALDSAQALPEVKALALDVARRRDTLLTQIERTLDKLQDYTAAAQQVRALMFVERFSEDIDRRLEELEQ